MKFANAWQKAFDNAALGGGELTTPRTCGDGTIEVDQSVPWPGGLPPAAAIARAKAPV